MTDKQIITKSQMIMRIAELSANLVAKEQECETLEKALKLQKGFLEHTEKKCERLKQTLTKIKEICNNNDELKGGFNLVDCDKYKLGKHNLAQKIIAKINEVNNG